MAKRYTENTEAYQLYLKGRYLWNRRTPETLRQATEYFQRAINKDSGYALAWAGLADCYAVYAVYDLLPPREAIPKTKEAASRALALDDTLAEAHAALAYVKGLYEWDWPGAERGFKRAIELDPNYSTAHHWYALYLEAMGRLDEAIAETKRAQETDPLSLIANVTAGQALYFARRYDQAIEQARRAIEMDPSFYLAHWLLAMVYEQAGRYEDAIAEGQKALNASGGAPSALSVLGHAYAASGKRSEALKVLAELKNLSKQRYVSPLYIAVIYVGLGDKVHALEWLEKAHNDRSDRLCWIKAWPEFDSLREEPRFQDILRRMNLTP
jgi:tetratricopeptide (TPR) repeat protein